MKVVIKPRPKTGSMVDTAPPHMPTWEQLQARVSRPLVRPMWVVRPNPPPPDEEEDDDEDDEDSGSDGESRSAAREPLPPPMNRSVMLPVFRYLSVNDLKVVMQVCRVWAQWAIHPSLWKIIKLRHKRLDAYRLMGIIRRQPNALDLSWSKVTKEQLSWLLARLPQLHELHLQGQSWQTISCLTSPYCPPLSVLNVSHCEGLTDATLTALLSSPRTHRPGHRDTTTRLKQLTELQLAGTQIGDEGVRSIVRSLPFLTVLNLSSCLNITELTAALLAHPSSVVSHSLSSLDLRGCHRLAPTCLPSLKCLPLLSKLALHPCSRIPLKALKVWGKHHGYTLDVEETLTRSPPPPPDLTDDPMSDSETSSLSHPPSPRTSEAKESCNSGHTFENGKDEKATYRVGDIVVAKRSTEENRKKNVQVKDEPLQNNTIETIKEEKSQAKNKENDNKEVSKVTKSVGELNKENDKAKPSLQKQEVSPTLSGGLRVSTRRQSKLQEGDIDSSSNESEKSTNQNAKKSLNEPKKERVASPSEPISKRSKICAELSTTSKSNAPQEKKQKSDTRDGSSTQIHSDKNLSKANTDEGIKKEAKVSETSAVKKSVTHHHQPGKKGDTTSKGDTEKESLLTPRIKIKLTATGEHKSEQTTKTNPSQDKGKLIQDSKKDYQVSSSKNIHQSKKESEGSSESKPSTHNKSNKNSSSSEADDTKAVSKSRDSEKEKSTTDPSKTKLVCEKEKSSTDSSKIRQVSEKEKSSTDSPKPRLVCVKEKSSTDSSKTRLVSEKEKSSTDSPKPRLVCEKEKNSTDSSKIRLVSEKEKSITDSSKTKLLCDKEKNSTDSSKIRLVSGKEGKSSTNSPKPRLVYEKEKSATDSSKTRIVCEKEKSTTDSSKIRIVCDKEKSTTDSSKTKLVGEKEKNSTDSSKPRLVCEKEKSTTDSSKTRQVSEKEKNTTDSSKTKLVGEKEKNSTDSFKIKLVREKEKSTTDSSKIRLVSTSDQASTESSTTKSGSNKRQADSDVQPSKKIILSSVEEPSKKKDITDSDKKKVTDKKGSITQTASKGSESQMNQKNVIVTSVEVHRADNYDSTHESETGIKRTERRLSIRKSKDEQDIKVEEKQDKNERSSTDSSKDKRRDYSKSREEEMNKITVEDSSNKESKHSKKRMDEKDKKLNSSKKGTVRQTNQPPSTKVKQEKDIVTRSTKRLKSEKEIDDKQEQEKEETTSKIQEKSQDIRKTQRKSKDSTDEKEEVATEENEKKDIKSPKPLSGRKEKEPVTGKTPEKKEDDKGSRRSRGESDEYMSKLRRKSHDSDGCGEPSSGEVMKKEETSDDKIRSRRRSVRDEESPKRTQEKKIKEDSKEEKKVDTSESGMKGAKAGGELEGTSKQIKRKIEDTEEGDSTSKKSKDEPEEGGKSGKKPELLRERSGSRERPERAHRSPRRLSMCQ